MRLSNNAIILNYAEDLSSLHGEVTDREVDIFDRGSLPQFGGACACLEALLLTQRDLLVDQQAEPFGVFEGAAFWIGREIAEPLCHAVKAKFAQAIQCWVVQQRCSPQWK